MKSLRRSNIYEVNTRQYSKKGNFTGVTNRLEELRASGVEIIWFMPIHPIGEKNRKGTLGSYYSIRDFKGLNPEFGNESDFSALVNKAHLLGMKVIIDWVANHAAWDNTWTLTNPEFFIQDSEGNFKAPYDWDDVIQINHANEKQQEEMINSMAYWLLSFDIDGFRADLAHLTPLNFWRKAKSNLEAIKPGLIWLAETEDPAYHEVFQVSYAWEWMHACEAWYKGDKLLYELYEILKNQKQKFPPGALQLLFTSNHDENSWNGTEFEKFGNYAKALTVFNFTWPGIPLIYSGQEVANEKRLKFFDKDEIDWDSQDDGFRKLYSTLSNRRKISPAITGEATLMNNWLPQDVFSYEIFNEEGKIMVWLNMSKSQQNIKFTPATPGEQYFDWFREDERHLNEDLMISFILAPGEYKVIEKRNPAVEQGL